MPTDQLVLELPKAALVLISGRHLERDRQGGKDEGMEGEREEGAVQLMVQFWEMYVYIHVLSREVIDVRSSMLLHRQCAMLHISLHHTPDPILYVQLYVYATYMHLYMLHN